MIGWRPGTKSRLDACHSGIQGIGADPSLAAELPRASERPNPSRKGGRTSTGDVLALPRARTPLWGLLAKPQEADNFKNLKPKRPLHLSDTSLEFIQGPEPLPQAPNRGLRVILSACYKEHSHAVSERIHQSQLHAILENTSDNYRNHYQVFEYGLFGSLSNVSLAVLFVSVFKALFIQRNTVSLLSRLVHFSYLFVGYLAIFMILAIAFDPRMPRKFRFAFHGLLAVAILLYILTVTQTIAFAALAPEAQQEQVLYLCVFVVTIAVWVVMHVVLHFLGKPHRWRTIPR